MRKAHGVRFGVVLADAGYGASAAFRQGLEARHLLWAVGVPRTRKVYGAGVQLRPPGASAARCRRKSRARRRPSWPSNPGAR